MSSYAVVIDVMLGVYLANFIAAFLRARFGSRPKVHVALDLLVGAILLVLAAGAS